MAMRFLLSIDYLTDIMKSPGEPPGNLVAVFVHMLAIHVISTFIFPHPEHLSLSVSADSLELMARLQS